MESQGKFSADIGSCLRRGWELYKKEWPTLTAATFLAAIAMAIIGSIPFAGLLLWGPLLAGLYILIIKIDAGEPFTFSNYFDGFRWFVPLLVASILTSLLVFCGYLLFILPGIYLTIAYAFTTLNIVDRDLDFWPAMETSRKEITAHFLDYLLLAIVMFVIILIAAIPFGLGVFFALPVCLAAQYYFYKDMRAYYAGSEPDTGGEQSPAA